MLGGLVSKRFKGFEKMEDLIVTFNSVGAPCEHTYPGDSTWGWDGDGMTISDADGNDILGFYKSDIFICLRVARRAAV